MKEFKFTSIGLHQPIVQSANQTIKKYLGSSGAMNLGCESAYLPTSVHISRNADKLK